MEKIILCLAGYAILLTGGWRAIKEQGRKLELALFVFIVACCMYISFAKLFRLPVFSVLSAHDRAFLVFGKWMMKMLGTNE
ncbi:MAG: hypothetical protein J7559_20820 [Cohnella sp.]|nr:hypothetical protein [Cohnella sp.]